MVKLFLTLAVGTFALLVGLPLLAILLRVLPVRTVPEVWLRPDVLQALHMSVLTSAATLAVALVLGTPVALALARGRFPGRAVLDVLVELPLVMPPAVAGIALVLAFGPDGLAGGLGLGLPAGPAAIILAQVFVSAPLYIRSARAGFVTVSTDLEAIAKIHGISRLQTFRRVTLPLAAPSILSGALLCWARALGEVGATLLVARSLPFPSQPLAPALMPLLETDLDAALAAALLLIIVSLALLVGLRLAMSRLAGAPSSER